MLSIHSSPVATLGGWKTGGMNVYVRELSMALGRLGILIDVFTRRQHPDAPDHVPLTDTASVYFIDGGPPTLTKSTADMYPYMADVGSNLIRFAQENNRHYQIIHSHYWLSGVVAMHLKRCWQIPTIQMFHTLGEMKNRIAPPGTNTDPPLRIQTEQAIVDDTDYLIAATPAERVQLLWLYQTNVRKVRIISPGVDLDRFQPIPSATARTALGISDSMKVVLFVGRIERLKGIDHLMEAIKWLQVHEPTFTSNLKLLIIGGDPEQQSDPNTEMGRLNHISEELSLRESVNFLGARSQDDLQQYYSAADVVIMPSHYESFGMVALEAMACGTPVIASEVGGLAYLVQDGLTGFHVPDRDSIQLAQKIKLLLETPALQHEMSQNAVDYAQQYSWAKIADEIAALYVEALQSAKDR